MGNNIDFCLVFCFVDLFSYHFFSPSLVVFFFPCGFVCFIIYDCYYFFSHVLRRIAHPMVSLFHPTRSPTKSNQKSIWGLNDIIETRKRKPKKKNNGGNSLVLPSKKSNCYQHPVILLISFFFSPLPSFFLQFRCLLRLGLSFHLILLLFCVSSTFFEVQHNHASHVSPFSKQENSTTKSNESGETD